MHRVQMVRFTGQLTGHPTRFFKQDIDLAPDHRLLGCALLRRDQGLQPLQPVIHHRIRQLWFFCSRGAGPGRILEGKCHAVAHRLDQIQCGDKIGLGLSRETDDEITRQQDIGTGGANPVDQGQIVRSGMLAVHRLEDAIRPGLHRQVQIGHQLRLCAMGGNQGVIHVVGMRCGIADALKPVDLGQLADQRRQTARRPMPGIHILTQQSDFAHPGGHQIAGFLNDPRCGAADFAATGVGHNAKRTEFVAALLHGQECSWPPGDFGAGGQMVKLVIRGEISIQRPLSLRHLIHHRGQAVITLRADHQIDQRHPAQDLCPFGLCHTAGHADAQIGFGGFQRAQPANVGKYLFGRFFADMAGVEQNQIGLFGHIGGDIALGAHGFGHALAVIDVHLTAIGLDEQFLGRGMRRGHRGPPAGGWG